MKPLSELRDNVGEELRRLNPEDKVTPIDRDPVPVRYSDLVRRYYQSLAEGNADGNGTNKAPAKPPAP